MKRGLRSFGIDASLLGGGVALAILGMPLVNGRWILIVLAVGLISIPVARSKNLQTTFWTPREVNRRTIKLELDKEACMGVASCVKLAPQVFKLDEASLKSAFISYAPLVILDEKGASNQTILDAAMSCPYRAIILADANSGERVYP